MAGALVLLCLVATSCERGAERTSSVFATPDQAVAALSDAIRRADVLATRTILGQEAAEAVGDEHDALMGASGERVLLEDLGTGCVLLRVGFVAHRLPIALQSRGGAWRFVAGSASACRTAVAGN